MSLLKTKIPFIIFTIALLLSACKKEPIQFKFEGKITDRLSGAALEGVKINISQKKFSDGALTSAFQLAGTALTDSNGDFNVSFDREKSTQFLVEAEKANYFPVSYEMGSADVSTEKTNDLTQTMDSKAWIQFNLLNEFGDETDEYKIIRQTFREGCYGCATNSTVSFFGLQDTSFTYLTTGGEYVKFIKVNVINSSSQLDSIYATPFETSVYDIVY